MKYSAIVIPSTNNFHSYFPVNGTQKSRREQKSNFNVKSNVYFDCDTDLCIKNLYRDFLYYF